MRRTQSGPARPGPARAVHAEGYLGVITWESEEGLYVLPLIHETLRAKRSTGCPRHFVTSALIFCFHVSG